MILDDYKLIEKIDSSSFSKIWKATKEGSNDFYSVHQIKKYYGDGHTVDKYLKDEIEVLEDVYHPNIIKLLDVKENPEYYFLIFKYINGGNLFGYIQGQPLSEEIVQYIMKQLVDVIKYLHDKKIVHRNIKPENILIKYDSKEDLLNKNILKSKIILIGFGLSTHFKKGDSLKTFVGTKNYAAPELQEMIPYNEKVDIWSLGITCYASLFVKYPVISYKKKNFDN